MITLMGPPKVGKTIAAATLSAFFPDVLPAKEKTYLKDTVWIQFDLNGTESLSQMQVFPYLYDLSRETEYASIQSAIASAIKEIKGNPTIKNVVIDTVTALDTVLLVHFRKMYPEEKVQGLMYNQMLAAHMNFAMQLKQLNATVVAITHTKMPISVSSNADAKAAETLRKRASSMAGGGDIVPEITGRAANYYKGASSAVWPVVKSLGAGKRDEYWVLPYGGYGFEGGCRYEGLEDKEPANLKNILKKVGASYV